MKKIALILAILLLILANLFTCNKSFIVEQKKINDNINVEKDKLRLLYIDKYNDSIFDVNRRNWLKFKHDALKNLNENEIRINNLKNYFKVQKIFIKEKKIISDLEIQNLILKDKIMMNENEQTNWKILKINIKTEIVSISMQLKKIEKKHMLNN